MRRYIYKRVYTFSSELAYVVGLFASDGCLINNGRHLNITSKDIEIVENVQSILDMNAKVTIKKGQFNTTAFHLHFSNVALYDFLTSIGLTPSKSKTLAKLEIPDIFYADFLRGYFDGDGTVYGYWDKRWKSSFMYYCGFVSASPAFLEWLRQMNQRLVNTSLGKIKISNRADTLTYAKKDSRLLFDFMYHNKDIPILSRKYTKFIDFIEIDPYASRT